MTKEEALKKGILKFKVPNESYDYIMNKDGSYDHIDKRGCKSGVPVYQILTNLDEQVTIIEE